MTRESLKILKKRSVLLLMLAAVCLTPNYSQAAQMALLLQQTPVDGGKVEPGIGVHRLSGNSQITLRAVPQPGYQFVTWLGDVDEPYSPVTEAYMDSPKIVIAVFERTEYEAIAAAEIVYTLGSGGRRATNHDLSTGTASGTGGKRSSAYRRPRYNEHEEEEDEDDFPVPDEGEIDDFPVPGEGEVPEPATVILLILGGALVRMRGKRLGT